MLKNAQVGSPGWKETARTERTTRNLGDPDVRESAKLVPAESGNK